MDISILKIGCGHFTAPIMFTSNPWFQKYLQRRNSECNFSLGITQILVIEAIFRRSRERDEISSDVYSYVFVLCQNSCGKAQSFDTLERNRHFYNEGHASSPHSCAANGKNGS